MFENFLKIVSEFNLPGDLGLRISVGGTDGSFTSAYSKKYGGESLAGVASCKKWVFEKLSVTSVTFLNMPIHGIVPLPTDYDALINCPVSYTFKISIHYNMDNTIWTI